MFFNKLRRIVIGLSVAMIVTTGFIFTAPTEANYASCVCAERINWLGQCRGETIRLCKGGQNCTSCGDVTVTQL